MLFDPMIINSSAKISHKWIFLGYFSILIFTPYFITSKVKTLYLPLLAGIIGSLLKIVFDFGWGERLSHSTQDVVGIALICQEIFLLCCVIWYSCAEKITTRESVFGSLVAYFLIAMVFGDVYYVISKLEPGAFISGLEHYQPTMRETTYFSFATITTLGYGDIIPASQLTRRLSNMEAAAGVLYVAVFIGRVIALFSARQLKEITDESKQAGRVKRRFHLHYKSR
jgi:hypothetical protein